MEVQFTEDQRAFVRQAIDAGRYAAEEDAVREALLLWESRERRRMEILAAVDEAEVSLAVGASPVIASAQDAQLLAERVKLRARARLQAESR